MALAGCAKLFGPDSTAGLAAEDPVNTTGAVVIMGLQASEDRPAYYKVVWSRLAQEQPHTRLGPGFDVSDQPEFGLTTLVGKPEAEYHAFQVPPGRYVLDNAEFQQEVTVNQFAKVTLKPRPETIGFEVAAGDIAYIGTFSFDVPKYEFSFWRAVSNAIKAVKNTRFVPVAGRPDAVPEIRAQFPNIKGAITRPALEPITLTLPGGASS